MFFLCREPHLSKNCTLWLRQSNSMALLNKEDPTLSPVPSPASCLVFSLFLHWFYFLSDSLLSAFYLLTWQGEGIDFFLISGELTSESFVSIKCCIAQDPLNVIRGDEPMVS